MIKTKRGKNMKKERLSEKLLLIIAVVFLAITAFSFSAFASDTSFSGGKYDDEEWNYIYETFYIEKSASTFDFNGKEQKNLANAPNHQY